MKRVIITLAVLSFFSCKKENTAIEPPQTEDTSVAKDTSSTIVDNVPSDASGDYQTMYVVVADTSASYTLLHQEMYNLHNSIHQEIDTMGRYYDKKLDKIILPEDDEDEIYAGDYFPRRYASTAMSLEYLDFYNDKALTKTIALVTGIYENKNSADSARYIHGTAMPKAYTLKAEIYLGCMH